MTNKKTNSQTVREERRDLARAITFAVDSSENRALLDLLNKLPERFEYGELIKQGEADYRMQLKDEATGREYSLRLPESLCQSRQAVLQVEHADKKYTPKEQDTIVEEAKKKQVPKQKSWFKDKFLVPIILLGSLLVSGLETYIINRDAITADVSKYEEVEENCAEYNKHIGRMKCYNFNRDLSQPGNFPELRHTEHTCKRTIYGYDRNKNGTLDEIKIHYSHNNGSFNGYYTQKTFIPEDKEFSELEKQLNKVGKNN